MIPPPMAKQITCMLHGGVAWQGPFLARLARSSPPLALKQHTVSEPHLDFIWYPS